MCTPTLVTRPRDHDHPLIGGEFFDPPTDFQASNSRKGEGFSPRAGRANPEASGEKSRKSPDPCIAWLLAVHASYPVFIITSKLPNLSFLRFVALLVISSVVARHAGRGIL